MVFEDELQFADNWLITGRGEIVRYIRKKIVVVDGKEKYRFLTKPSKRIVDEYNLSEKLDPETEMHIAEYPYANVVILQDEPGKSKVFVECDYGGGETTASRKNADLKLKIEQYQQENKTLKSAIARKQEVLHQILTSEFSYAKDVSDYILTIRKSAGQTATKDKDDLQPELSSDALEQGGG